MIQIRPGSAWTPQGSQPVALAAFSIAAIMATTETIPTMTRIAIMSPTSRVRLIRLSRLYRRIIPSRIHPGEMVEYRPLSDHRLTAYAVGTAT